VSGRRLALLAALVVAVPLLVYPLTVLASGEPRFPGSRDECARVATGDEQGPLEVVSAHLPSIAAAQTLRDRLAAAGFDDMRVEPDGCGWWKVTTYGFDSGAKARALAAAVRGASFPARVELDPGP